jgi:lysophospholipase L1-like esterase
MRFLQCATALVTCALLALVPAVPVAASDAGRDHEYLALGDSVAFGYNPLLDGHQTSQFVGYPELLAPRVDLDLTNAACPGETSASFVSANGVDTGCHQWRANFPLHTNYAGTQLEYIIAFLRAHPRTRLVTVNLGANDLFLLESQCGGATNVSCVLQGLPAMLRTLAQNLTAIYTGLRVQAHYHHSLVALTYYTLDYSDPVGVEVTKQLNATIAKATQAADGTVTDGFDAFRPLALAAGGSSCAAGLLIELSPTTCDVHPSRTGQAVLAAAIQSVLREHP